MAVIETYDWFAKQFFTRPDEATAKLLREAREYLLTIRNENERLRYIEEKIRQVRESVHRASA